MSYVYQKMIRPHDKYKELHKYILDGDKIFRKDIVKMGFNRIEVTLYNYCNKHKLKLRKVNEEYWIKDENAVLIDILPQSYLFRKRLIARESNRRAREASKLRRRARWGNKAPSNEEANCSPNNKPE